VKTPRPTEGLTLKHLFQWFQPFNRFAEPALSTVERFKSLKLTESVGRHPDRLRERVWCEVRRSASFRSVSLNDKLNVGLATIPSLSRPI